MVIKELRFAFVQTESITDPLAALTTPTIPYQVLLSAAQFEGELEKVRTGVGMSGVSLPWVDRFGKRFWFYYLEKTPLQSRTANQMWRHLVPLRRTLEEVAVSGMQIPATVATYSYLYPWGIGLIVDVGVEGTWTLEQAVNLALKVRQTKTFDVTAGDATIATSLEGLMARALAASRAVAYGPAFGEGHKGEVFSIVTVIDADGVDAMTPVKSKDEVHRALEAWTGWSPLWKVTSLKDIQECTLDISKTESTDGHLLYGGRRGRAVWFPAKFRSVFSDRPDALLHYHQNLSVSTMQTESLCQLSRDAAGRLAAGQTKGQFSVAYRSCVVLAAGILGRLWGKPTFYDSYRSASLRDQIKRTYFDAVNTVRAQAPDKAMDALA